MIKTEIYINILSGVREKINQISCDFSLIQNLIKIKTAAKIQLKVKRDDLLPFFYGGNKARKILKFAEDIALKNCNAIVTNGGVQSNHARVAALFCAEKGYKCKLILHGEPEEIQNPRGNLLIMHLAGAEIEIVQPDRIAGKMRASLDELKNKGFKPYEILGGGHGVFGSLAYAEAVKELETFYKETGWKPDYIVHASGTGTTQAGLIAGLRKIGWNTKVIGISVARRNPRGKAVVENSCSELLRYLNMQDKNVGVDFRDEWICGGYGKADNKILNTIKNVAKNEGLILDPTYTGKAFTGMLDLINNGEIPDGSKVLFWHTGGMLNLQTDNFFKRS